MAWRFQQIEPQPARGALVESMWSSGDYVAEEKYDGDRRIAQFCGPLVRFTGRRISVQTGEFVEKTANVPHLAGPYKATGSRAPPAGLDGTVLDGEMIVKDSPFFKDTTEGRSKFVTSIMGSLPDEAIRKQKERGWLRYVVFDCLFYKGQDLRSQPYVRRRSKAALVLREWANPHAYLAEWAISEKRRFYEEIVARGGEGIILKRQDHVYGDKRGWIKVKKQDTADVVIMGYKAAKLMSKKKGDDQESMTKYAEAGLIGAVVCGQYQKKDLVEVATVSGMDDQLRRTLTLEGKDYLGLVIEIAHNGREPTGRFRHPRFKRFREDKAAHACAYREGES